MSFPYSLEGVQFDIETLKKGLHNVAKKSDIDKAVGKLVTKDEIEIMVQNIVTKVLKATKEELKKEIRAEVSKEIREEFDKKLTTKSNELKSQVEGLRMDLKLMRETISEQNKLIEKMRDMKDDESKLTHSIKNNLCMANFNEQYSRKNNIKIMNWEEGDNDKDLRKGLIKKLNEKANVVVKSEEIVAIHRIPGKAGETRPVLVKFANSECKVRVMKNRKDLRKASFNVVDEVTRYNMKLIKRLADHEQIEYSYYFNSHIYGVTTEGERHRFDVFDDIDKKIKEKPSK